MDKRVATFIPMDKSTPSSVEKETSGPQIVTIFQEKHVELSQSDSGVDSLFVSQSSSFSSSGLDMSMSTTTLEVSTSSTTSSSGEAQRLEGWNVEGFIKAKENYAKNLRSIDLKQFAFENEFKPKTSYTYAETPVYNSTLKKFHQPVIPNLCRRSLHSSSSSSNLLSSSISRLTSSKSETSTTTQKSSKTVRRPKEVQIAPKVEKWPRCLIGLILAILLVFLVVSFFVAQFISDRESPISDLWNNMPSF